MQVKNECRLRVRHLKERGIVLPAEQTSSTGTDRADVIHLFVLVGSTGTGWIAPVGHLILDRGATAAVAVEVWAAFFLAALSPMERADVTRLPSDARLKFGTGEYVTALEQIVVPLRIGSGRYRVRVHDLPGSLPLLVVSRPTLTSMGAVMCFKRHVLRIDEEELRLDISPAGHNTLNGLGVAGGHQLAGVAALAADTAPASPAALLASVRQVVDACQVCKLTGPAPPRSAVALPRVFCFDDLVAVDLFFLPGTPPIPVFHAIDYFWRFFKCTLLSVKTATETGNVLVSWVVTFGTPGGLLHDDGGEFVNRLWRLIGDRFGIKLHATSTQSPWSNGRCESHNAVSKRTFSKLLAEEPTALT